MDLSEVADPPIDSSLADLTEVVDGSLLVAFSEVVELFLFDLTEVLETVDLSEVADPPIGSSLADLTEVVDGSLPVSSKEIA